MESLQKTTRQDQTPIDSWFICYCLLWQLVSDRLNQISIVRTNAAINQR